MTEEAAKYGGEADTPFYFAGGIAAVTITSPCLDMGVVC